MRYSGSTNEFLELVSVEAPNCSVLKESLKDSLTILWFETDHNVLNIDGVEHTFQKNQIVCLTEFHKVEAVSVHHLRLLRFNRPFYCIVDHDNEVGCKGILFFGASQLPVVTIPAEELEKFQTVWKMFLLEMQSVDDLQFEMLQTMLKRYLILVTRLYKQQCPNRSFDENTQDIVRELNYLVEQHYRTKHTVSDYAEMLHKSPKTISNIFSKLSVKTPLQFIQDRKMLEARRLLHYTDKPVKEIAYELGYEDIQAFSRFFKVQEHVSPTEYREKKAAGRIANMSGIAT